MNLWINVWSQTGSSGTSPEYPRGNRIQIDGTSQLGISTSGLWKWPSPVIWSSTHPQEMEPTGSLWWNWGWAQSIGRWPVLVPLHWFWRKRLWGQGHGTGSRHVSAAYPAGSLRPPLWTIPTSHSCDKDSRSPRVGERQPLLPHLLSSSWAQEGHTFHPPRSLDGLVAAENGWHQNLQAWPSHLRHSSHFLPWLLVHWIQNTTGVCQGSPRWQQY